MPLLPMEQTIINLDQLTSCYHHFKNCQICIVFFNVNTRAPIVCHQLRLLDIRVIYNNIEIFSKSEQQSEAFEKCRQLHVSQSRAENSRRALLLPKSVNKRKREDE